MSMGCHACKREGCYSSSAGCYATFGHLKKGVVGLENLGNTCFMNSALQCLSNTPPLRSFFITDEYAKTLNRGAYKTGGKLAEEFAALLKTMWDGSAMRVAPRTLKLLVGKLAEQFEGYGQQDAMEFLEYLVDGLREDCNEITGPKPYIPNAEADGYTENELEGQAVENYRKRNISRIDDLFQGFMLSTICCPEAGEKCGRRSVCMDPYTSVKLVLPDTHGRRSAQTASSSVRPVCDTPLELKHLLRSFVETQAFDAENKWYCDRCNAHKEASKKLEFRTLPPVLVVQLKRFEYTDVSRRRIDDPVSFPLEGLDMAPFCTESAQQQRKHDFLYDLVGVCQHLGTEPRG